MSHLLRGLAALAGLIAGMAILLLMVHVSVAVVLRVGFNAPANGTIVIVSYFYMVSAVFLGIFVASWEDVHIRVDVLARLFGRRLRAITDWLAEIISLGFFLFFAWGLWRTALQKTRQQEAVDAIFAHLTIWPSRWIAVAGVLLATLVVAWRLWRMFRGTDIDLALADQAGKDDEAA